MSWVRRFELGSGRKLEPAQEARLREILCEGPPSTLSLLFALWSRRAVQATVKSCFGVEMPLRTVTEYLRRWGFTPQRPVKRALDKQPAEVQRWLDPDYPAIARRAKAEGGEIHWGDECAVRQDTAWVRGFAPAGQPPEMRQRAHWDSLTLISAISQRVQKAAEVQDWLKSRKRHRSLLPAAVHARSEPRRAAQPRPQDRAAQPGAGPGPVRAAQPCSPLHGPTLQADPERIKRCFQHSSVRYAA